MKDRRRACSRRESLVFDNHQYTGHIVPRRWSFEYAQGKHTQREREGEEQWKGRRSHVAAQGVATKTSGLAGGRRFCANSRLQNAVWNAEIEAVERRHYPRVHTRGPIEARSSTVGMTTRKIYPRVHTRGPIEAASVPGEQVSPPIYPRVHTRGPIEAEDLGNLDRDALILSAGSHPRPH